MNTEPNDFKYTENEIIGSDTENKKRKKSKLIIFRNILIIFICLCLIIVGIFVALTYKTLGKAEHTPLDSTDLGIETNHYEEKIQNIALFGIDSRKDNYSGRSDALIVLTVDKNNNKIKLTSIARDSYVNISGKMDKLTHAYSYGKSQLAVKTLNQNFDLEIEDYVTINFFGLVNVIDYIGGVNVDISQKELEHLNGAVYPGLRKEGKDCPDLPSTGINHLNGTQALAYARIRYIDSDLERTNRQKEVLSSMYEVVKGMSLFELPKVVEMVLKECETSLTSSDIIALGSWAIVSAPTLEQHTIPNANIPSSGKFIKRVWYYVYDITTAKNDIKDFILEQNKYANQAAK